jgi:hypothetical protein
MSVPIEVDACGGRRWDHPAQEGYAGFCRLLYPAQLRRAAGRAFNEPISNTNQWQDAERLYLMAKKKTPVTFVAFFEAHTGRIVRLGDFKQSEAPLALAEARARFGPLHNLRVISAASLRESPLNIRQNGRAA